MGFLVLSPPRSASLQNIYLNLFSFSVGPAVAREVGRFGRFLVFALREVRTGGKLCLSLDLAREYFLSRIRLSPPRFADTDFQNPSLRQECPGLPLSCLQCFRGALRKYLGKRDRAVQYPIFVNVLYGQAPTIQWQKALGGINGEEAYSIKQTSDGGYIVVGKSDSNNGDVSGNHGVDDYWITKLDTSGNLQIGRAHV